MVDLKFQKNQEYKIKDGTDFEDITRKMKMTTTTMTVTTYK